MNRIALCNMAWGFMLIFIAACGGAFVALQLSESFVYGNLAPNWKSALQASSHGHSALFGLIHIALGLTLPYAKSGQTLNKIKTVGLFAGSFAMGPLMLFRASIGPTLSTELNGIILGACLSFALISIFIHAMGITQKILLRQ